MIRDFIRLEWKQTKRSPNWNKSIFTKIVMGFLGLYLSVSFILTGIGLFFILKKTYPEQDPLVLVNAHIYYWLIAELFIRFFLQKLPIMNVKSLLILPIKKNKILHYILGRSLTSFFNFLPLFIIIPFCLVLIGKGYALTTSLTWMVLMILFSLTLNFVNFIIESKSTESNLSFFPILLIGGSLLGLNYFEIISLSEILASTITSITEQPYLITIPILFLIGIYSFNYKTLEKKLTIDGALKTKEEKISTNNLEWLRKFGSIAPFLQLDLKLLWRNKRPKSGIFVLVIGLLYGLIFYPNPTYKDMEFMYVFVGIFTTGIFLMNFGQFIPAWDAGYYKLLMSQNIKYKEYLNSKYSLMFISCIIMFVLSIPYVYFGWKVLALHFAGMMYNIGVNSHVLLFAGSYNRKSINLNEKAAFNYQGTGAVQWLISIPLMGVPILIFVLVASFFGFITGAATLIVLGFLGIVLHKLLMKSIIQSYIKFKYKMISAFEQKN